MNTTSHMLDQIVNQTNEQLLQKVEQIKQNILNEKKTGALVVLDGQPSSLEAVYLLQQAVNQLNSAGFASYCCIAFFLDDDLYSGISKNEVISKLKLTQPIQPNIDEALEELILEAEYSYKKLGMSKHMSISVKQQFRMKLAKQTAEMIALDMNLLYVE